MKILAITQARSSSTRLPKKVLKTIQGQTLLSIHLKRVLKSKLINQLVLATTTEPDDKAIEDVAIEMALPCFRGSLNDVLDRYYRAAEPYNPDWVVRVTSDCPLIDAELIDRVITAAIENDVDYCSNCFFPSFPDGMDTEVFKFSVLKRAWSEATAVSDREHVTPYIYNNSNLAQKHLFRASNFSNSKDYNQVRLTVDEPKDFEVVSRLIESLGTDKDWQTYADYYLSDPAINTINSHIERNEGYRKS